MTPFTVSDSLSVSRVTLMHPHFILIPLCEGSSIRSCVTDLLSDWMISVLHCGQQTKSPSLLGPLHSLFLPYPSPKAQLRSFIIAKKKKKNSQDSVRAYIPQTFYFWLTHMIRRLFKLCYISNSVTFRILLCIYLCPKPLILFIFFIFPFSLISD